MGDRGLGTEDRGREAMAKQGTVYKFQQLEVYQLALEYVDHIDLRLRIVRIAIDTRFLLVSYFFDCNQRVVIDCPRSAI